MIYKEIELDIGNKCVGNSSGIIPKLVLYLPDNSPDIDEYRKRKTIIICPGGGYHLTSDREAEPVALKLVGEGYNVFILRYSVAPASFPTALCEVATAVSMIREHYMEWNVDVDKIVVAGFSAGGHLAASLATLWHTEFLEEQTGLRKEQYKPNGVMLGYPAITAGTYAHRGSFENLLQNMDTYKNMVSIEENVTENMPKTFLWHTYDDQLVPVENSLLLVIAMKRYNIPLELHIYPHGIHGLSLADAKSAKKTEEGYINKHCQSWVPLFIRWLDVVL